MRVVKCETWEHLLILTSAKLQVISRMSITTRSLSHIVRKRTLIFFKHNICPCSYNKND